MMQAFINAIVNNLQETILVLHPVLGIMLGILVIMMESMIPIMPLGVFITFNVLIFGNVVGFIMSYIGTVIGCILMFYLVRRFFGEHFRNKTKKNKKLNSFLNKIDDIEFSNLVLITALPFTPAFVINIAAGLSKMEPRKFFFNIIISKLVIVYFWAYVGTTFVGSMTDVVAIVKLAILLLLAFVISKYVMKKQKID